MGQVSYVLRHGKDRGELLNSTSNETFVPAFCRELHPNHKKRRPPILAGMSCRLGSVKADEEAGRRNGDDRIYIRLSMLQAKRDNLTSSAHSRFAASPFPLFRERFFRRYAPTAFGKPGPRRP